MAAQGAPVQGVMTDNALALAYRRARDFKSALAALCAKHVLIKPRQLAAQLSSCDLPLRCSGVGRLEGG
jgi:hypothetical protein